MSINHSPVDTFIPAEITEKFQGNIDAAAESVTANLEPQFPEGPITKEEFDDYTKALIIVADELAREYGCVARSRKSTKKSFEIVVFRDNRETWKQVKQGKEPWKKIQVESTK